MTALSAQRRLRNYDAERRRAAAKRLETMRARYDVGSLGGKAADIERIEMRITDWQRDEFGNLFRLIFAVDAS